CGWFGGCGSYCVGYLVGVLDVVVVGLGVCGCGWCGVCGGGGGEGGGGAVWGGGSGGGVGGYGCVVVWCGWR
ncbi:hypothetical protein, partial [Pseudomonas syringae group genomosp. 7]|uniref:hypothetical protein n=1 Tax=Pseudomonas syringae group genomosp. 7 TaxID=251699 RepID=UPI00376FC967